MKIDEVPQDKGMIGEYGREVCYAVGDDGRYRLASSLGWEAKNIVNDQAWEVIAKETAAAHAQVLAGELSPIAYYRAKHQMDLALLATYVGMAKWRIKRHQRPEIFQKLPQRILARYAKVFAISITELQTVPATFTPDLVRQRS